MSRRRPLVHPFLAAALALGLLPSCSSSSTDVNCSGLGMPAELHLDNLTPALGATVPNQAIVHSFTVLDDVILGDYAVIYTDAHTAGAPDPGFTFPTPDATNTYTAAPVTWQNAPAHVEFEMPLPYQTPDGCAYRLPSPVFSYDITEP